MTFVSPHVRCKHIADAAKIFKNFCKSLSNKDQFAQTKKSHGKKNVHLTFPGLRLPLFSCYENLTISTGENIWSGIFNGDKKPKKFIVGFFTDRENMSNICATIMICKIWSSTCVDNNYSRTWRDDKNTSWRITPDVHTYIHVQRYMDVVFPPQ